ncbi:MAG: CRISPR-associated helicase Cas3' [Nitrososphaeria archaeon]|nr:CRISPR-associated helicase Cas3' [Nitrososphaeria archaeon]
MKINELIRSYEMENFNLRYWQKISIEKVLNNFIEGKNVITFINLPTGYGKTLIGLSPLLYQIKNNSWIYASWLCYVLPTRALCNSLASKMIDVYLKNLVNEEDVKIFHGGIEDAEELFSSMLAITTFDTFLLSYARRTYGGHHLEKPAGFIATSYLVFDEAQMISDKYFYSYSLLKAVIERLLSIGVPIIFMTATLPSKIKEFIFEKVEVDSLPEFGNFNEKPESYRGKIVNAVFTHESFDNLLEKEKSWKKLLIIANTVERAARIYDKLNDNILKFLVHSRLVKKEREKREKLINKFLDSKKFNKCDKCGGEIQESYYYENINNEYKILCENCARRAEGKIYEKIAVVTTQVIEAGLDVSSDLLITDLAPADALVQRCGRCARFLNEKGKVYILDTDSPQPYPDILIKKTREEIMHRFLKGILENSLTDYSFVQDFVNESYKEFEPLNYTQELELEDIIIYLRDRLLSFTVDWKMIEKVKVRPESQITVVAPSVYHIAYVKGESETEKIQRYRLVNEDWLIRAIKDILDEVPKLKETCLVILADDVRDNSFSVSIGQLNTLSFLLYNDSIFILYPIVIEGKKVYMIKSIESQKFKQFEEGIYIMNPHYYSDDKGLVSLK